MIGTIIAAVIMAVYLGWYIKNYGVPASISQTVYKLPHEIIFTLVIWTVGALTAMPIFDHCSDGSTFLAFLSIGGLMFVGAVPLGKNYDERIHLGGAIFFGFCSQIMIAVNSPLILLVWLPFGIWLICTNGNKYLFWLEMACVIDLLIYCLS